VPINSPRVNFFQYAFRLIIQPDKILDVIVQEFISSNHKKTNTIWKIIPHTVLKSQEVSCGSHLLTHLKKFHRLIWGDWTQ